LIFTVPKAAKPEGTRWWCRFPKHNIVDYVYTSTSEQAICFIPNDDIEVIGYGAYMHQYDYVHSFQIHTMWKIYDESNTNLISEGEHPNFTIEDEKFKPDKNKMLFYDFTKDFTLAG